MAGTLQYSATRWQQVVNELAYLPAAKKTKRTLNIFRALTVRDQTLVRDMCRNIMTEHKDAQLQESRYVLNQDPLVQQLMRGKVSSGQKK